MDASTPRSSAQVSAESVVQATTSSSKSTNSTYTQADLDKAKALGSQLMEEVCTLTQRSSAALRREDIRLRLLEPAGRASAERLLAHQANDMKAGEMLKGYVEKLKAHKDLLQSYLDIKLASERTQPQSSPLPHESAKERAQKAANSSPA